MHTQPKSRALLRLCAISILMAACSFARIIATGDGAPAGGTPAPTASLESLSVPGAYLTSVRVVLHDPLRNMDSWTFDTSTGESDGGVFQLEGTERWHSHLFYDELLNEGEGVIVQFKVENANGESEFVFVSGAWLTDTFRQFGMYNSAQPKADLFQGLDNLGGYTVMGNLAVAPGTWYDILLAVGHGGHFIGVMWDPAHPSQRAIFDLLAPQSWAGRSWSFYPKANTGETLYVDDFYHIRFTAIK
jgi:hypothetical protein